MSEPFTFRPLSTWPGDAPGLDQRRSTFRAGYADTLVLLDRELAHLGASRVVLELALQEGDLRLDGRPRAHARPAHPGVVLSFESRYGPVRYPAGVFDDWRDNLRAIALSLEALRKVDRYGVSRHGEQYRGWKALGAGGASADRGRQLIAEHGSVRAALSATHPDHGGSPDDFADVQAAREEGG